MNSKKLLTKKDKTVKSLYTSDYNKFNMLAFNRPTAQAHVSELYDSIEHHGNLGAVICIVTSIFGSKNGIYIIDGQHRFNALMRHGYEIEYKIVAHVTSLEDIIQLMADLNNTSKAWTLREYATCWAALNRKEYIKLLSLYDTKGIGISSLITLYGFSSVTNMWSNYGGQLSLYKTGKLSFGNEEASDKCIEELMYFTKKFKFDNNIIQAAGTIVLQKNGYRRNEFERILKDNWPTISALTNKFKMIEILKQKYNI